MTYVLNPNI